VTLHITKMAGETGHTREWLNADAQARIEAQAVLARPIRTYSDLRKAMAARRRLLGWSQQEVDHRAGLQSGYVGKLEVGVKELGDLSMECLLGALGVELYVVQKATGE
jgi:hypothetical protein